MPSLASWQRGRKSYVESMQDRFNPHSEAYGFDLVKNLYGVAYRLETALDEADGIDPKEIDTILAMFERQVEEWREWQLIKERQHRELNATIVDWP